MRRWKSYVFNSESGFRSRLLNFSTGFSKFIFLDSCDNSIYGKNKFKYALAAGAYKTLEANAGKAFDQLKDFIDINRDWIFGYFGYDLKNEIEKLYSNHPDRIGFSDMVFFVPEILVIVDDEIRIGCLHDENDLIFSNINSQSPEILSVETNSPEFKNRISKADYISKVESVRQHIIEGDIYEMNLCQEFYADNISIDPLSVFNSICESAKAPFSSLFRWEDKFLISASPERFLQKAGNRIISQPIKGTMRRSDDPETDRILRNQLFTSEKDRAENVMIVDLVRNDLAKSCVTGSIKVEELFGIYSFDQVHQMVSTISGEIRNDIHIADLIKNAFPMGSMTGAPKVKAMELIEKYEESKRGLYSGSIGYFDPERDFDFNVVIRSILFNRPEKYLSIHTGGAIVFDSDPEAEYEECLLKINSLARVLGSGL